MDDKKLIILHYGEIALKKGNRRFFEGQLKKNITQALTGLSYDALKIDFGRFLLFLNADSPLEAIIERLKHVVGLAHFNIAYPGSTDIDVLKNQVLEKLQQQTFDTFCIDTKRADKNFPLTSVEVNQIVGAHVHDTLKKSVRMRAPDLVCAIQIYNQKVLFSCERFEGLRGLPVNCSGRVVALLSSGIDSPVAIFRMLTRGCKVIMVHFHSYPFTDKNSYYNTIKLAEHLTRYQYHTDLYLIPLFKIQEAIIAHAPAKIRLLLYRRMMFRLAEMVAKKERAKALITGESLGQVASQTLENIAAISAVVSLPVLRPLIGTNKEMIMHEARAIGTYATSIEPYDDCCSFLVPSNPETRADVAELEAIEQKIENLTELARQALQEAEIKKLNFPL
jgi:thiamine biosynthesis protein ThiI